MRVKFWGVRGSYPVPSPRTNRYGGNTSCVQVLPDDGSVVVLDAGTGIRPLGKSLARSPLGQGKGSCHLLFSHTHWDHIQGLPFFAPLYIPGNDVRIYARQREMQLKTIFVSQTEDPYFPVGVEEVAASMSYVELIEGVSFAVGGAQVRCARLNHPNISLGYRLDADGGSVAYVSDTGPFSRILFVPGRNVGPDAGPPSDEDQMELDALRDGVVDLCRGCDLVVYDTMFFPHEYEQRPHWGHSTAEHALEVAEAAGAHALALFHYGPEFADGDIDRELARVRGLTEMQVVAAAENLELELTGAGVRPVNRVAGRG